jgi:acyl-CoA thioesterase-1
MHINQFHYGCHRFFLTVGLVWVGLIIGLSPSYAASVLVLGDSLSAGYGMPVEQGWVSLWQQRLQASQSEHKLINASISGETSAGGLARLPALLQQHQPQWLIIELGANDALRGQDLKRLEKNLATMILLAQAQSTQILLLGIQLPTNYGDVFNQRLLGVYQRLALTHHILLDPFFLADVALQPNGLQLDGLHPTAAAQQSIMMRVSSVLAEYVK